MLAKIKEKLNSQGFISIMSFLILETLAFSSFVLGEFSSVIRLLGIILFIACIPFFLNTISSKELKNNYFFIIPLFLFSFISALGKFYSQSFPWYINISVFLGLISFYFLGMIAKKFKIRTDIVLIVLMSAISLIVFLSLVATIFKYGLFHSALYKNKYYWYNGEQFLVSKEVMMLYGLSFTKVDIKFYSLFGLLLTSNLCAIPFINYKDNKKLFVSSLAFGVFGLLSLVLVGSFSCLLYLLPLLVLVIYFKFLNKNEIVNKSNKYQVFAGKINKYLSILIKVFSVLVIFFIVLAILIAHQYLRGGPLGEAVKSNHFLEKLFITNRHIAPLEELFENALVFENLFGFDRSIPYVNSILIFEETGMFEFEILKQSGVIGVIILIILIFASMKAIKKSFNNNYDKTPFKSIFIGFIVVYFSYESFNFILFPLIHEDSYNVLVHNTIFLVILFMFGYLAIPNGDNQPTMEEIASNFVLDSKVINIESNSNGHINETFIIKTESGKRYVLHKLNHNVFPNIDGLVNNILLVTEEIKKHTDDCVTVIKAKDGKPYYYDGSTYYRLITFIENSVVYDNAPNLFVLKEAGKVVGEFEYYLKDFDSSLLYETIPNFHNTSLRLEHFKNAVKADVMSRKETCQKEIDFVLSHQDYCSHISYLLATGQIPYRVTHNDTKLNNILFDKLTNKGKCLIDLDTIMTGSALYDFGDFCRVACSTAKEDEEDLSKVHFNLDNFKAFLEGYLSVVSPILAPLEFEYLPESAIILTLECGIRFLDDYLDGDHYFKINKENHNLIRARTQFKLVEEMINNLPLMKLALREVK